MENKLQTLSDHLEELRHRLFVMAAAILFFTGLMYAWHEPALRLLSQPLELPLYYLSPAGGFMLAFNVSLLFGIIASIPVIAWQFTSYIAPAIPSLKKKQLFTFLFWSVILAISGALFAYFVTLPTAIKFLNQFATEDLTPLITAEEYVRFAMLYLAGFALLFQIPIIVWIINKIKPLKPSHLFRAQRQVILTSFILAAILTPTPDPFNQLLLAVPPIILYYACIVVVWLTGLATSDERMAYIDQLHEVAEQNTIGVVYLDSKHEIPVNVHRPYHPVYWDIIPS